MPEDPRESLRPPKLREQTANEFLDQLRPDMPGAVSVEKMKVPDAKRCLVHIRQMRLPLHERKLSKGEIEKNEKFEEMRKIQTNIYSILHYLSQSCGTKEVFMEGLTKHGEGQLDAVPGDLRQSRKEVRANGRKLEEWKDRLQEIEKKLNDPQHPLTEDMREDLQFRADLCKVQMTGFERQIEHEKMISTNIGAIIDNDFLAAGEFFKKERLKLRAAEDSDINMKAVDSMKQGNPNLDAILGERENFALSQCSQSKHPVSVMIFGGAHDWKGGIEKWNREHPEDKYSLVVITPKAYKE